MIRLPIRKAIDFLDQHIFKSNSIAVLSTLSLSAYALITLGNSIWIQLAPYIVIFLSTVSLVIYFAKEEFKRKKHAKFLKEITAATASIIKKYSPLLSVTILAFAVVLFLNKCQSIIDFQTKSLQQNPVKEVQAMSNKHSYSQLKKFSEREFFENIPEFNGYLSNRKKDAVLNPDKLVNLLSVYLRSVLLFPSPDMDKYTVQGAGGKFYEVQINTSENTTVSLGKMSHVFLSDICKDLLKSARLDHIISLIELFSSALVTPSLERDHKLSILNAENTVLKDVFSLALRKMPESMAKAAIDVRLNFAIQELSDLEKNDAETTEIREENKKAFNEVIAKYIQYKIDILISNNKFVDIFQFLYVELENHHAEQTIVSLLHNLIVYNNLFLLERKDTIRDELEEHRRLIGDDKYAVLDDMLNFSPADIELKNFSIMLVDDDGGGKTFKNQDYEKVRTQVSFVVPYASRKDYSRFEQEDKYTIEFIKVHNLFDDPVFQFFNKLQQNINGMPTTIFSDALGNIESSTVVRITMNEFFHPDFELIDDKVTFIDFEEKEAKLGRKYYPHKDRIIEMLLDLQKVHPEQIPFDLPRKEIDINLVSNYLVNYLDQNMQGIYHQAHTVTNLDSYLKVKKRYLEEIAKLNLSSEFMDMRELLFETEIVSARTLQEFIYRAIDLTVKKSIELRGINKYLWSNRNFEEPLNETDIQPIIKTHLQPILEAKGVQISREIVAANGSLDFLCTYTFDGRLFKVGVELKKAHHDKLLNGLTQQLPQYLQDEGTNKGIYLVLWFKNDTFGKPAKYDSLFNMTKDLERNVPKKYQIKVIGIDCTKQPAPSTL